MNVFGVKNSEYPLLFFQDHVIHGLNTSYFRCNLLNAFKVTESLFFLTTNDGFKWLNVKDLELLDFKRENHSLEFAANGFVCLKSDKYKIFDRSMEMIAEYDLDYKLFTTVTHGLVAYSNESKSIHFLPHLDSPIVQLQVQPKTIFSARDYLIVVDEMNNVSCYSPGATDLLWIRYESLAGSKQAILFDHPKASVPVSLTDWPFATLLPKYLFDFCDKLYSGLYKFHMQSKISVDSYIVILTSSHLACLTSSLSVVWQIELPGKDSFISKAGTKSLLVFSNGKLSEIDLESGLVLKDELNSIFIPNSPQSMNTLSRLMRYPSIPMVFYTLADSTSLSGYTLGSEDKNWELQFGGKIISVTPKHVEENLTAPINSYPEDLINYHSSSLIGVLVQLENSIDVFAVNGIKGSIHGRFSLPNASDAHIIQSFHSLIVDYWNINEMRTEILVVSFFVRDTLLHSEFEFVDLITKTKVFWTPWRFVASSFTRTESSIAKRNILFSTGRQIFSVPFDYLSVFNEISELDFPDDSIINYNIRLEGISNLVTFPTHKESTSAVLGFGQDLFYSLQFPSGRFDSLSQDFSKLNLVLSVLIVTAACIGLFIFNETRTLKRNWQ